MFTLFRKQGRKLLTNVKGDYEELIDRMEIKYGQLQLKNLA
jgi:hypothetical protein